MIDMSDRLSYQEALKSIEDWKSKYLETPSHEREGDLGLVLTTKAAEYLLQYTADMFGEEKVTMMPIDKGLDRLGLLLNNMSSAQTGKLPIAGEYEVDYKKWYLNDMTTSLVMLHNEGHYAMIFTDLTGDIFDRPDMIDE